jgi:hypothetical protein
MAPFVVVDVTRWRELPDTPEASVQFWSQNGARVRRPSLATATCLIFAIENVTSYGPHADPHLG